MVNVKLHSIIGPVRANTGIFDSLSVSGISTLGGLSVSGLTSLGGLSVSGDSNFLEGKVMITDPSHGAISLGAPSSSPYIDFTSTIAPDYDARIQCVGGTSVTGGGVLATYGSHWIQPQVNSIERAIRTTQYASGTTSGPTSLNLFSVFSDNVQAVNPAESDYFVEGWTFERSHGGGIGGRNGLSVYQFLTSPMSLLNDNRNYCAMVGVGWAYTGDNGTDSTSVHTSLGGVFGSGFVGGASAGATHLLNVTAGEDNTAMQTGSSCWAKSIRQFSGRTDDAVAGSYINSMLWFYNQASASAKWDHILLIDDNGGTGYNPLHPTNGKVIEYRGGEFNIGIDFEHCVIHGFAMISPGFAINGGGEVSAADGAVSLIDPTNGGLSMGKIGSVPYIDMTTTAASDYDVRIQAYDGTGTTGQGSLAIHALSLTTDANFYIDSGKAIYNSGQKVLGGRDTGWTAMTGTSNKATSYSTGSITLPQLAERVNALQTALTTHGILG